MNENIFKSDFQRNELIDFFTSKYKQYEGQNSLGLYGGRTGSLLVQMASHEFYRNPEIEKEIQSNFDFIIDQISNAEFLSSELSHGISGFGYVCQLLSIRKILKNDIEGILCEIDDVLKLEIKKCLDTSNLDLLHGALGMGLYLMKRKRNLDYVKMIVNEIDGKCEARGHSVSWKRFDDVLKEDVYDFGLAHGIAGTLFFLGKCYENNIEKAVCYRLIKGGLQFLKNNEQKMEKVGSFFPSKFLVKDFSAGKNTQFSRLSWCYGDLGILHTMLLLSYWMNDKELKEVTVSKLLLTASRRDLSNNLIEDAGFCHGSSGLAILYRSIYNLTYMREFLETANYWDGETLKFARANGKNVLNHKFILEPGKPAFSVNLLTGLGGVLLSFLPPGSTKSKDEWKELFFLQ